MEKRAYERLFVKLQSRIFYGNMVYSGTVTNISEDGMFINTKISFPVDSMFVIAVLQNGETLKISVKVKRISKSYNYDTGTEDHGIGVMLISPPHDYISFVGRCRSDTSALYN